MKIVQVAFVVFVVVIIGGSILAGCWMSVYGKNAIEGDGWTAGQSGRSADTCPWTEKDDPQRRTWWLMYYEMGRQDYLSVRKK